MQQFLIGNLDKPNEKCTAQIKHVTINYKSNHAKAFYEKLLQHVGISVLTTEAEIVYLLVKWKDIL